MDKDELVREVTKKLIEEGKLIEAGFAAMKIMTLSNIDVPPGQIRDMRVAFFAGAHHVLASIMTTLDPGEEPTDADMNRIDLIHKELDEFIEEFKRRHLTGKGPFQ
jgi:hypothetical protein